IIKKISLPDTFRKSAFDDGENNKKYVLKSLLDKYKFDNNVKLENKIIKNIRKIHRVKLDVNGKFPNNSLNTIAKIYNLIDLYVVKYMSIGPFMSKKCKRLFSILIDENASNKITARYVYYLTFYVIIYTKSI